MFTFLPLRLMLYLYDVCVKCLRSHDVVAAATRWAGDTARVGHSVCALHAVGLPDVTSQAELPAAGESFHGANVIRFLFHEYVYVHLDVE